MNATSRFTTQQAERYLGTLCKHFGHKVPVTHDAVSGHIDLPFGTCSLTASEAELSLATSANDREQLDRTIQVITNHFERFAFRENPNLVWSYGGT